MPTHDYIISNGTGAAVRADINLALSAIVSLNSSASEPATMYAYQLWADTAAGLLKIRNGANSAWITLRQLDGDFSIVAVEDGLQATPSLTFTNDLNTGIFRPGNDSLAIVTGATRAITITSTQAVGIQTANPNAALHVAGNARVGADDATDAVLEIGAGASGNRTSYIDIVADTTYTDYGLRVIRNNTGANATSELKHRGTGALNFTTQEAAPIVFNTTNSPRATIDSSGRLLVGTSTARANFYGTIAPQYQIEGTGLGSSMSSIISNRNDAGQSYLVLAKTRGAAVGSNTVVQSGDYCGTLSFHGADGAKFIAAASIDGVIDGTPGTDDMPGRLVFSTTADGGSAPTERMRIKADGDVSIVTGNLIIGTSGKGIDFSATANSSGTMTNELLSDYEEGTWTPSLGGTATYTFSVGRYTKIGRQVTIVFDILVASIGTGSDTTLTGAPFSTGASGEGYGTTAYFDTLNVSVIALTTVIANNTSAITFISMNASGTSATSPTSVFKNSTRIQGSITYSAT